MLCGKEQCRLLYGHSGNHVVYPTTAWNFLNDKDQKKIVKAGFATPRGGAKNAYQNHVVRSNRVIVPFEKLNDVPLAKYSDGFVIRLLPEQYFESAGTLKKEFLEANCSIKVGTNAYILYRTEKVLASFPPLSHWKISSLEKNGKAVKERGRGVIDVGHYVVRLSTKKEGVPQGLFAPEYADTKTNYLCKCVLVWLIVHTINSPYTTTQAKHLQAILEHEGLLNEDNYEFKGVLRRGLCSCPLCLRLIRYEQLHEMVYFDDAVGNENASDQVEGATRSTIVNLFHISPLRYDTVLHIPTNVAWGHAVCNTRLGQRPCISLEEIKQMGRKVGIIMEDRIDTFGWISNDEQMIRSPLGAVWIQLNGDMKDGEDTPPEPRQADMLIKLQEEDAVPILEDQDTEDDELEWEENETE